MKQISNAFIIGGLFGVVGQLFIFGWTALLGQGNQLVNPLTMVTMGVLGLILFFLPHQSFRPPFWHLAQAQID